jgi:hypothetical protein
MHFIENLIHVLLDAAPWLVIGLAAAGIVRALVPDTLVARWLGGKGPKRSLLAALIGTPLPLCSCSVLPVAVGLRRQGAGKGPVASFLVSTPENGADSIALSYALLGPVFAVARPFAAIVTAVTAGLLVDAVEQDDLPLPIAQENPSDTPACSHTEKPNLPLAARLIDSQRYAFSRLLGDIMGWLLVGLIIAALLNTFISPDALAAWGQGITGMFIMLVVGVPLYICATASTPVAAALITAGVSPGAALVFLLAGPATNIGSLAVVRNEIGTRGLFAYLFSIALCSIAAGIALNALASAFSWDIQSQAARAHQIIPLSLQWAALALLTICAAAAAGDKLRIRFFKPSPAQASSCCTPKQDKPSCGCG